jgi:tetratricopeptide (TPR) repeat protein
MLLVLLIFVTAMTIRFVYFAQIKNDFFFQTPYLDAQYYDNWAKEIVSSGDWLSRGRGVFVISPGYSYFLAVIYRLFGSDTSQVVVVQLLIGSISCVLVFLIARKAATFRPDSFGESRNNKSVDIPATISALLAAAYGISLFYEGLLVKASLINFLNLLMLYLLILGTEKNKWIYFLSAGLCLGFSAHLRPNILVFIPFVFVLHILSEKNRKMVLVGASSRLNYWKRQVFILSRLAPFLLGILIFLAAGGLRNYVVGRQFVMTTAHGGMNFYTGNNPQSFGPYFELPFAASNPEAEIKGFHEEAERRAGHRLTAEEADRLWYKESWSFMSNQPVQWLKLMAKKALIFINNYEDSINLDYEVFRRESKSILSLPLITYGIVVSLGLWGMFICGRNNYATQLLTLYFISYFLVSVAFFVVSEYRYPVVPVLAIFAGQGLWFFFNNKKAKWYGMKVLGIAFLIFSTWLTNKDIYKDWFGLSTYHESILSNAYYSMGNVYANHDQIDKAREFYSKAITFKSQPGPLIQLGALFLKQGMINEAKQMFENAIHLYPQDTQTADAYVSLGMIYMSEKNYQVSEQLFQQGYALKLQSTKQYK